MKFLLKIFGINYATWLQRKSGNVYNVFTKTVTKLTSLNNQIQAEKEAKLAAIAKHQATHDELHAQSEANGKMISKLNEFLN